MSGVMRLRAGLWDRLGLRMLAERLDERIGVLELTTEAVDAKLRRDLDTAGLRLVEAETRAKENADALRELAENLYISNNEHNQLLMRVQQRLSALEERVNGSGKTTENEAEAQR